MVAAWLLILPLTLDTFAVSTALGLQRLDARARLRVTALFTAFEGGMPLVGAVGGRALDQLVGPWASWLAVAVLALAGLALLFRRDDDEERLRRLATSTGPVQIALGLSISLDELAIGFTFGLLAHVPIWAICLAIAAQAALVSQLGLALGSRVGERVREGAERAAGVVLILLAAAVAVITAIVPRSPFG